MTAQIMVRLIVWIGGDAMTYHPNYVPVFLGVNILFTLVVWLWFSRWRGGIYKYISEKQRHGSARFANEKELLPYRKPKGFYVGFDTYYRKAGHLLTVAGTRAGKGVNLILQNLLMPWLFENMSFVVIDPKGELAAVSANLQRQAGRKVVILNPWNLWSLGSLGYNPLDILKSDPLHLADDVQMIAESIVPMGAGKEDDHFQDRARTFISTLLLHLVTTASKEDRHIGTLWQWLRLDQENWIKLLADMMLNDDPHVGDIVKAGANEIAGLMKTSEREYGSVMSSAQKCTDFIKSPALREAMKGTDGFTSADLASGNVTVYLCIPFDRLKSHSAWLRLVVTSLMRSVVRNPEKDVCFLIDEAYASIGYHSEIDMALGGYAGFGIHVWLIYQSLVQIRKIFGDNWENLIANCSVRHFFNVSDNFSADYISHLFGNTSIPTYNEKGEINGASARPLVTADELRRESCNTIYTVIDQFAPVQIPKVPYYEMNLGYDANPYYKPEIDNQNGAARVMH
jgi:type IV secretion system protein VirD4